MENPKLTNGPTLGRSTEAQSIREQLENLALEEKQLMELAQLRKILAEKQEDLVKLRNKSASIHVPPSGATTTQTEAENTSRPRANQEARGVHEDLLSMKSMTAKDLWKLKLAGKLPTMEPKPLDALLNSHDCAALPKATDVNIGQIGNGTSQFMKSGRSWESELLSTHTKSLCEHFSAK